MPEVAHKLNYAYDSTAQSLRKKPNVQVNGQIRMKEVDSETYLFLPDSNQNVRSYRKLAFKNNQVLVQRLLYRRKHQLLLLALPLAMEIKVISI